MKPLSLTLPVKRFFALSLLLALLGSLWLLLVDPILTTWGDRATAIETTEKQYTALRRRANWSAKDNEILLAARQVVEDSTLLIRAPNASLAAAQFQADVRRRMDSNGAQTRSILALPPSKTGGLERIIVRVEGSVGGERLLDWLQAIEAQSTPLMVIEALELRGPEFVASGPAANAVLQFRLDIAGYRKAEP